MNSIDHSRVHLHSGFWLEKAELNRKITIRAVYEQFARTGRLRAFDMNWREGEENRPHIFWDSDVAKWMEGAAYSLAQHPDTELEAQLDALIEKIRCHQGADGYFNTYFTALAPAERFRNRDNHELYCAGHLIEAAIACDAIGKPVLLSCMKQYVAYIRRVFMEEKSAGFSSPGHEEIELALLRLYRHTGEPQYRELAEHFIHIRGTAADSCDPRFRPAFYDPDHSTHNQSHRPVREQTEAVGHAVRALYLYTGMAMLAKETDDTALLETCRTLYTDITRRKMYVSGGVGSTHIGEAFTNPYDLPNDTAYAETCAAIALVLFCRAMLENEPDGRYADTMERALYNGVLSGLSLDGRRFFYVNALEINRNEHFQNPFGAPHFPLTQRPEIFSCSCCPPNLNRLLASVGGYLFGREGDVLYVHQYAAATLQDGALHATVETAYPLSGQIRITAAGAGTVALRIPAWCTDFRLNHPYTQKNGYAYIRNDGSPIELALDLTPRAVFADSRVARDAYRLCIQRGPVVYCAEEVDNGDGLHRFSVAPSFGWKETAEYFGGLPALQIEAYRLADSEPYTTAAPARERVSLRLIPYNAFANRGESDMRVWFPAAL